MSSNPLGARSGPPGSRRGRAPKPLPPPPTGSATEQGEVPLTACDLYALTAGVGLPVRCGLLALAEQATKLREALHDYVLWCRARKENATPGELRDWAASVGRWAADGAALLDNPAITHLLRGVPRPDREDWPLPPEQERERLATLRRKLCEARVLGDGPPEEDGSYYGAIRALVGQMRAALAALDMLAGGLAAHAARLEAKRRPDREREALFQALAEAFVALTGKPFTVSNLCGHATDSNRRDNRPTGPALDWVRALFALMAERAAKLPPEVVDRHPEFQELAEWSGRSDAVAERIGSTGGKSGHVGARGRSGRK